MTRIIKKTGDYFWKKNSKAIEYLKSISNALDSPTILIHPDLMNPETFNKLLMFTEKEHFDEFHIWLLRKAAYMFLIVPLCLTFAFVITVACIFSIIIAAACYTSLEFILYYKDILLQRKYKLNWGHDPRIEKVNSMVHYARPAWIKFCVIHSVKVWLFKRAKIDGYDKLEYSAHNIRLYTTYAADAAIQLHALVERLLRR